MAGVDGARRAAAWKMQRPPTGELVIDHLGHFVPDANAGAVALEQLGFVVPPFSIHLHRNDETSPLVAAGTGNRCVMLERGYLEFLSPISDAPNAREVLDATARYVGVHLIAFGTNDPRADYARLAAQGFRPTPVVDLQRQVETAEGEATVKFRVVRALHGAMEEGRIQFCEQRAPEVIWQPRWMDHPNRARTLEWIVICVADPFAVAQRFSRFTGLQSSQVGETASFRLDTLRGAIGFLHKADTETLFHARAPAVPWIAGYVLGVDDIEESRRYFRASGLATRELGADRFAVAAPQAVGGFVMFQPLTESVLGYPPGVATPQV